jgi:uncharacterized RDD family membrane protein YckC
MNQWYYAVNGAQQGPVPLEHLTEWVRTGQLAPDAMVWRDGMAQWLPVSQVPELVPALGGGAAGGYGVAAQPAYGSSQGQYGQQPASPLGYAQPPSAYGYEGYRYGGFWWRVLAYIVDYIVLYLPNLAITAALQGAMSAAQPVRVRPGQMPTFDSQFWAFLGVSMSVSITLNWLYFSIQESSKYQATLGKRVCGLVVTDLAGQRLTFGRATGRYFGKILSGLILYIGFIMVAFTERKQGLHDQIASTLVWKKP